MEQAEINQINDYKKIKKAICYLSKRKADEVDLIDFAASLNLNKRQFTDLFKRWCGLSPKTFMQAVALNHAKKLLEAKKSMLDVSLEVGFSSTSRLHDLFVTHHAMPPGAWANKGKGLDMIWGVNASPFGMALLFTTKYGLAGLAFFDEGEEKEAYEDMANRWKNAKFIRDDGKIKAIANRIFDPKKWDKNKPIEVILIGSDFEVRVWQSLIDIPLGEIDSYGELAKIIDKPKAARAVGAAIGRNPISFVVPCHRVIGKNGKLTGYHWGLERKQAMLGWEVGVKGL